MRPCLEHGCPTLVEHGRCPVHEQPKRLHERRHYTGIPGVNYGRRWRKLRALYLSQHPFCVDCRKEGKLLVDATEVDHIIPHKGDARLFWDETNWQALCKMHHSAKTQREVRAAI